MKSNERLPVPKAKTKQTQKGYCSPVGMPKAQLINNTTKIKNEQKYV